MGNHPTNPKKGIYKNLVENQDVDKTELGMQKPPISVNQMELLYQHLWRGQLITVRNLIDEDFKEVTDKSALVELNNIIGNTYLFEKKFQRAITSFKTSIEIDLSMNRTSKYYYHCLGYSEIKIGNFQECPEKWYARILKNNMNTDSPYNGLDFCLLQTGQFEIGEEWVLKYLYSNPSANLLGLIGTIHLNRNDLDKAQTIFERLGVKHKDEPFLDFAMANYHYKKSQWKISIGFYEKVLSKTKLLKDFIEGAIGRCYGNLGNQKQSIYWLKRSLLTFEQYSRSLADLADIYYKKNEINQAIKLYMDSLAYNQGYYQPHYKLGVIYQQLKQQEKSIRQFKQCIKLNSNLDLAYNSLGILYFRKGNLDQSIDYLEKSVAIKQQYLPYYNLGTVYQKKKEFQKAAHCFQESIKINPKFQNCYVKLAKIYEELGKKENLKKLYRKLVSINDKSTQNIFKLGKIYEDSGDYDLAIKQFEKCLKIDPKMHDALFHIGRSYEEKSKFLLALDIYHRLISACPDYCLAYHQIGHIYLKTNEIQKAQQYFLKASAHNPSLGLTEYYLGLLNEKKENYNKALQHYQKCVQMNSDHKDAYLSLAKLYFKIKNTTSAVDNFLKYLQFYDDDYEDYFLFGSEGQNYILYYHIGKRFQELGKLNKASDYYKKSINLNPSQVFAHFALGTLFRKLGNFKQAIDCFHKCTELEKNVTYYCNHAACLFQLESYSQSLINFTKIKTYLTFMKNEAKYESKKKVSSQVDIISQKIKQLKIKRGEVFESQKTQIRNDIADLEISLPSILNQNQDQRQSMDLMLNYTTKEQKIVILLYKTGFKLDNIKQIGQLVFDLYLEKESYTNILIQILQKYVWVNIINFKRSIIDVEFQLQQCIKMLISFERQQQRVENIGNLQIKQIMHSGTFTIKKNEFFKSQKRLMLQINNILPLVKKQFPNFFNFFSQIVKEQGGFNSTMDYVFPLRQDRKFQLKFSLAFLPHLSKILFQKDEEYIGIDRNQIQKLLNLTYLSLMKFKIDMVQTDIPIYLVRILFYCLDRQLQARLKYQKLTNLQIVEMIKGQSTFQNIQQLKKAAKRIISESKSIKYQIVRVQNKINSSQPKVIIKICINKVIAAFQLCLMTDRKLEKFLEPFREIAKCDFGYIYGLSILNLKIGTYSFQKNLYKHLENLKIAINTNQLALEAFNFVADYFKEKLVHQKPENQV